MRGLPFARWVTFSRLLVEMHHTYVYRMDDKARSEISWIRALCSHLSEVELRAAEQRFLDYLDLAFDMHQRHDALSRGDSGFDETAQAP